MTDVISTSEIIVVGRNSCIAADFSLVFQVNTLLPGAQTLTQHEVLVGAIRELQNFNIFKDLDDATLLQLCERGEVQVYAHRQIVFRAGDRADKFSIVLSGAFKLSRTTMDGQESIAHFSTPGEVIAALIMVQEAPLYPVSCQAMGPSRLLVIPRAVYLSQWKSKPELIFRIQEIISTRMGHLQAQKALSKSPLSAKIAHLLTEILGRKEMVDNAIIPIPVTRKEIAESLGASVESVIRIMSEWSKLGYIETQDQQIKVLKIDKIIEQLSHADG